MTKEACPLQKQFREATTGKEILQTAIEVSMRDLGKINDAYIAGMLSMVVAQANERVRDLKVRLRTYEK